MEAFARRARVGERAVQGRAGTDGIPYQILDVPVVVVGGGGGKHSRSDLGDDGGGAVLERIDFDLQLGKYLHDVVERGGAGGGAGVGDGRRGSGGIFLQGCSLRSQLARAVLCLAFFRSAAGNFRRRCGNKFERKKSEKKSKR